MIKAGNAKQAIDSLFIPGGTVDIIIRKITKNTVKLTYQNRDFTLNKWGVLCVETPIDGKIWYSFCPSKYPAKEIAEAVKAYRDKI